MEDNWILVYSTAQIYEAELLKSVMADSEIECVILNKQDSTYRFGDIEVYVPTESAFKAKQLILEFKGE
ncbi:MAG: DUF2007 domain-containing protein [Bacteroidota bacterium]